MIVSEEIKITVNYSLILLNIQPMPLEELDQHIRTLIPCVLVAFSQDFCRTGVRHFFDMEIFMLPTLS